MLQIVTASFQNRYRWRFSDGNLTFAAPMEDESFFKRIDDGERFGKGDILRVDLYERQWRDRKGLHAEYKILRVFGGDPRSETVRILTCFTTTPLCIVPISWLADLTAAQHPQSRYFVARSDGCGSLGRLRL